LFDTRGAGGYSRRVNPRIAIALLCCSGVAQTPDKPPTGGPEAAQAGNSVFRLFCAPCHGIRGQGDRGPDLTLGIYTSGARDTDLFRTISAGVLATGGGLVFTGDGQGYLVALDARTGKALWHFQTGGSIVAPPITYTLNGKQQIAIAAGSSILTFALGN
jgi:hypothetical protein